MATTPEISAFDKATDPILRFFTVEKAQELVNFRGDAELQPRIEELAGKCNEGNLSESELAEYQGYVRANNFIAILQAKARKLLATSK
jgi:hypothetical protein